MLAKQWDCPGLYGKLRAEAGRKIGVSIEQGDTPIGFEKAVRDLQDTLSSSEYRNAFTQGRLYDDVQQALAELYEAYNKLCHGPRWLENVAAALARLMMAYDRYLG